MLKLIKELEKDSVYYFACPKCRTVILVRRDNNNIREFDQHICPYCCDLEKYPFPYYTHEFLEEHPEFKQNIKWIVDMID